MVTWCKRTKSLKQQCAWSRSWQLGGGSTLCCHTINRLNLSDMMKDLHMLWEVILCSEDVSTVGDIVSSLSGRSHDDPHSSGTIVQDLSAHNAAKIHYLLCIFLLCRLNANFVLKFHWAEALLKPPVRIVVLWKKVAAGLLVWFPSSSTTKSSPLAGHHPTPNHLCSFLEINHYAAEIHPLQGRQQVCLHREISDHSLSH